MRKVTTSFVFLIALLVGSSLISTHSYAETSKEVRKERETRKEKKERKAQEKRNEREAYRSGRIIGKIIEGEGEDLYKRKLYYGKELYESDAMRITRYYDKNGKQYTVVKRK